MKRLLLTLLVVAMLTPSLACAKIMPCCPPEKKQSQEMPCHEQSSKKSFGVMFMKDCANVDLQSVTDNVLAKKQVLQAHDLFVLAQTPHLIHATKSDSYAIRAPPLRLSPHSSLPLYLSTQRLRI